MLNLVFIFLKFSEEWPSDVYHHKPLIALINSGGIRNDLDKGNISFSDMMGILPFSNTVDIVMLKGKDLRAVLESSAASLQLKETSPGRKEVQGRGKFLQVSGRFNNIFLDLFQED